jgi:hypothetical protein
VTGAVFRAHATRRVDHAIKREDVARQRLERRLIGVRGEDALFGIVEDDVCRRAQPPREKCYSFARCLPRRILLSAEPPTTSPAFRRDL